MTADSSHHSTCGSENQFRAKNLPSPWSQVVRGEPQSILAVNHSPYSPSSSSSPLADQVAVSDCSPASSLPPPLPNAGVSLEHGDENNNNNAAARPKKPAWNKPSNGVVDAGPVMGAVGWPALSESARASPKSAADPSSKTVPDGSISSSQRPVITNTPQKQITTDANPNSSPARLMPTRQRPGKRGGGGGGNGTASAPAQSVFTQPPPPPPPPPFPVFPIHPSSYGGFVPTMPESSPREGSYRGNNWEARSVGGYVSQPYTGSDHRNSARRGGYGPRGDGPYHSYFGGRRDQDRGNYANPRDVHMQQARAPPRGFIRPPPPNAGPFVPPPPGRPFGNPMGFHDLVYISAMPLEPYRGVPFITHAPPPPVILPAPEPPLPALLVHQIDYYFSDANLIKDEFLKSNMDNQGWVPISLIASFPRVKNLTNNIQLILDSLRTSTVVEVLDDKIRRRGEWMRWIHSSNRFPQEAKASSHAESSSNMLATSFQKITVEDNAPREHSSGLTDQSRLSNGKVSEDACLDRK